MKNEARIGCPIGVHGRDLGARRHTWTRSAGLGGELLRSDPRLKRKIDYGPDPRAKSILFNQNAQTENGDKVISRQI